MTPDDTGHGLTREQVRHAGQLYKHEAGWFYREVARYTAVESIPEANDVVFTGPDGIGNCVTTDLIVKGEEFVVYTSEIGAGTWARPARLFDDGRFLLVSAVPDLPNDLPAAYLVSLARADAEAGRAARAEEEVAELRRAVVVLALPAEAIVAVHSDGKYVAPETIQAFRDALTAARAALAPRPEAGATVGEGEER